MEEGEIGSDDVNIPQPASSPDQTIIKNDEPKDLQVEKCVADEKSSKLGEDGVVNKENPQLPQNEAETHRDDAMEDESTSASPVNSSTSDDPAKCEDMAEARQDGVQAQTKQGSREESLEDDSAVQTVKNSDVSANDSSKELKESKQEGLGVSESSKAADQEKVPSAEGQDEKNDSAAMVAASEQEQTKLKNSNTANRDDLENPPSEIQDTAEEGELGDSDEGELPESPKKLQKEEIVVSDPTQKRASPPLPTDGVSREDFGIDESRPEDEQLDYGEDDLEDKLKDSSEPPRAVEQITKEKSDGEVDSASDGEIKSDADGEDFEEGETRDHPLDLPPGQKKVCKFFEVGNCTWGDRCRYLHPGINDKGNYNMFRDGPKRAIERRLDLPPMPPLPATPFWQEPPPFVMPPVAETAWEKGLRHAKELKKKAMQRKVQEPDFMQKREVISVNIALNEDRDMEFVNNNPVVKKGFDPFEDIDNDEFATPNIEEVRRQMSRERRRLPPLASRHPHDRRLPPPPDHMMPPDMRRDRRPPSPRHRQDRYPPDMRRAPPRQDVDRRLPPNIPGLAHRQGDRRDRRDVAERPDNRGQFPSDSYRREIPQEKGREEKFPSDESKGTKQAQNGALLARSDQWNDPWARGRPQAKGRNKSKDDSSSSSGSSSRSSSRSSGSSHSSASGSSRSSSRSSGSSSSFSSDRDSSRSPSPSRDTKPKMKVLSSARQRNGAAIAQKKPLISGTKDVTAPPKLAAQALMTGDRPLPAVAKKPPPAKKPPIPSQNMDVLKAPIAKQPVPKPVKMKKRTSSSSSEFSRSSDSSPSPSRAKSKSGSDSGSGSSSSSSNASSSSGSSSSDTDEDDKPQNRRKPPVTANVRPTTVSQPNVGKVMVPSRPGRKDVKMTIIDKPGVAKKRPAAEMTAQRKKPSSRRTELLDQLKVVEDAIARKRAKLT